MSIAQYAARAEAAEAKIAELTTLAAQIQAVAGGAPAGGGEGIGEFKAYFLDKLKTLRVAVAEEHDEFLQAKAKNADLEKEVTRLKYRVEILTRELSKHLGTPVPESIFKAAEQTEVPKEAKTEEPKEKDTKSKEKNAEKGNEKNKEKGKEKGKDKEKEKGQKSERKPSEKVERKPSERKQSEKVESSAEPKAEVPKEATKTDAEPAVTVHATETGTEKSKKAQKGKNEAKKEGAADAEQGKKDNKKGEKPKKDSTRTDSEKGAAAPEQAKKGDEGAKKGKKGDEGAKKGDGKKGGEGGKKAEEAAKKEEPKKTEAKSGDLDEKAVKACLKEGGKKGQDCAGMATFGTHFFCVTIESADGNMKLLEKVMEGMNAEVDPEAEDRKGGANDLGKILFNANDQKLVMMCHTPQEVMEKATAAEWMESVLAVTGAKVTSKTENFIQAELDNDPDHGIYSLKLRDQGISASFEFLRSRGLMIDDDSEDENYAAAAGINLNAAPGADY